MARASGPAFLMLLLLMASCAGEAEPDVELGEPRAELHGVVIPFSSNKPLTGVRLLDSSGAVLQEIALAGLKTGDLFLPSEVAAEAEEMVALVSGGETVRLSLPEVRAFGEGVSLRSAFSGEGAVLVPAGEGGAEMQVMIGGRYGETLGYSVELVGGEGLTLAPADGGAEAPGPALVLEGGSQSYVRPLWRRVEISADDGIEGGIKVSATAALRFGEMEAVENAEIEVVVLPRERLAGGLGIASVAMPVAADGSPMPGRKANSIALDGAVGGSIVLGRQAVAVSNSLGVEAPVVLTTRIVDAEGKAASGFGDEFGRDGASARVAAMLEPGGETVVAAPIPGDAALIEPGRYERRVSLALADSGLEIAALTLPLEIERPAYMAITVTGAAVAIAVVLVLFMLLRGGRFLSGFSARQLVLVALVAASSVVLVNLPMFFLSSITTTLLGPLGMLVDALLSEFLFGALMVALVTVIPRQGVCAMVAAIRFLLGGVLLGMLTPVGLLHTAVTIAALEGAVWLSGAARSRSRMSGLRLIILFACGSALISWVGFQLAVVLFRLNYAAWYIALSVFVSGFLYSLFGATTGRRIGMRLAQVAA